MKRIRVVGSLTTMPDKYPKIIRTLESLKRQTYKLDAIYLGLPDKSRRLDIQYPELPREVKRLCTVVKCKDFGPITKILGALLSEDDSETVIITFDDDMIYPETMVEKLIEHHKKYPDSAIGSSGMLLKYDCPMCAIVPNEDNFLFRIPKFNIPKEGRPVDSIYGYAGALYVRKFFPIVNKLEKDFLNYALVNDDMFMNDDIVISGYLSLRKIERRLFPSMPIVSFVLENGVRKRNESEISYNLDKFFQRMNSSIRTCKLLGMYSNPEQLSTSETVIGISAIIVISVLILIVIIYEMFRSKLFR